MTIEPDFTSRFNECFVLWLDSSEMKTSLIWIALIPLAGCTYGERDELTPEELQSRPSIFAVDFGNDDSDFANDDECDDPRFRGPGMTTSYLIEEDNKTDASDCRAAYERGELTLIE